MNQILCQFIGLRINAIDDRYLRLDLRLNDMRRACMIVKYNERLLRYFKTLFADIFNQKRKKMHYLQTEKLAVTSCVTSAQQFALNFWSK